MADIRPKQQVVATSEAQIAVHWREEEYYYPSSKFIGQANLTDPDILNRFSEEKFPECFREYADLLSWDQYWHTTLDTQRSAVLEMVCGREDQRLLQLRRPASGEVQETRRRSMFVPEPEGETPVIAVTYRELVCAGE